MVLLEPRCRRARQAQYSAVAVCANYRKRPAVNSLVTPRLTAAPQTILAVGTCGLGDSVGADCATRRVQGLRPWPCRYDG
jgi:hypothetical protein